jgi:hypothetical protein
VAGEAKASAVPAFDLITGPNKLVHTMPLGSLHAREGNLIEAGPPADAGTQATACPITVGGLAAAV